jgi:hypothetical protein
MLCCSHQDASKFYYHHKQVLMFKRGNVKVSSKRQSVQASVRVSKQVSRVSKQASSVYASVKCLRKRRVSSQASVKVSTQRSSLQRTALSTRRVVFASLFAPNCLRFVHCTQPRFALTSRLSSLQPVITSTQSSQLGASS